MIRKCKKRSGMVKGAIVLASAMAIAATGRAAVAGGQAAPAVSIEKNQVPLSTRTPEASGSVTYSNKGATIDASNANNGYVMVKYSGGNQKIKVQITKNSTYTYDINARDAYEVYPITEGSGTYMIKVFENVSGDQYAQLLSQSVSVSLSNEFGPFLYPNQYVNFNSGSAAVATAAQLTAGMDQIQTVEAVYHYVTTHVTYDYAKAQSVKSGYLPNVDSTLATGTGICFDYAALMTAMLRSRDIPTKLVIGYTGDLYHAWVSVYINGVGWVDDVIYFDGTKWSLMDPTFISTGGNSDAAKQYVGTGANYREKYSY